jgi:hypothetical protein
VKLEDRRKEEIFTKKVKAGRRTYYFDVKENVNNDKYLIISETKAVDFGKQDRFRIMVFPEDLDNFQEAFDEVSTSSGKTILHVRMMSMTLLWAIEMR